MNSSQALVGRDHASAPPTATSPDPWQRLAQLEAELQAQEPVVGAAMHGRHGLPPARREPG